MAFNPAVAVMILIKGLATPVVLYCDQPFVMYDEIKAIIAQVNPASPKLIEKPAQGPLRKVCFLDTELAGVALQMDPSAEVVDPPAAASPTPSSPAPAAPISRTGIPFKPPQGM
jgi:hypothetical protein